MGGVLGVVNISFNSTKNIIRGIKLMPITKNAQMIPDQQNISVAGQFYILATNTVSGIV